MIHGFLQALTGRMGKEHGNKSLTVIDDALLRLITVYVDNNRLNTQYESPLTYMLSCSSCLPVKQNSPASIVWPHPHRVIPKVEIHTSTNMGPSGIETVSISLEGWSDAPQPIILCFELGSVALCIKSKIFYSKLNFHLRSPFRFRRCCWL